jgi:glycosyltransferase involved in cell wall biosynthesis
MAGIIFLGTDLQRPHNELASKNVQILSGELSKKNIDFRILSIQNEKKLIKQRNTFILPRFIKNNKLRKIFQAFLLPVYLTILRIKYDKIHTFWVADSPYHSFLFSYLKFLRYKIISTIIASYNKRYNAFRKSDIIITQSPKLRKEILKKINRKALLVYPLNEINANSPKKQNLMVFAAMPFRKEFLQDRGVFSLLNEYKKLKNKIRLIMLFRGGETFDIVKDYAQKANIKVELQNKILSKKELISLLSKTKIIVGFFKRGNIPDMPQSIIEGIGCGCVPITTPNTSIAELIKKEKAGIILKNDSDFVAAIKNILSGKHYQKNTFRLRDKYFNLRKNLNLYMKVYNSL